jgi:hypothetical protein
MTLRIVTDYTSGLADGVLAGVTVVGPDEEKRAFGDPPPRAAYVDAFRAAAAIGPTPVICLVGPYGYSPAFTAASAARNDLGRFQVHPNNVRVHNTGRAFLGLGAIAAALNAVDIDPSAAMAWLGDGATGATTWLIAETAVLEAAPRDYALDGTPGLPAEAYTLLRLRLSARVMGGFESPGDALAAAWYRAAESRPSTVLATPGLGLSAETLTSVAGRPLFQAEPQPWLRAGFGDYIALGVAPGAGGAA